MTYILVGVLILTIAGVMLAVLIDTLELFVIWRVGDPDDQGESRG